MQQRRIAIIIKNKLNLLEKAANSMNSSLFTAMPRLKRYRFDFVRIRDIIKLIYKSPMEKRGVWE